MDRKFSVLAASLIGAGLMFLMDPQSGARRRKLIRDQVTKGMRRSRQFSMKAARDLGHRASGLAHELRSRRMHHEGVDRDAPDRVLCDRVRSKMGHVIGHPGAVEVIARDGIVTLSGSILADEVDRLVSTVSAIPGVRDVDNQLRAVQFAEGVPSLQGGRAVNRVRQRLGRLGTPAGRIALGSLGAVIAAYGIQQLRHHRHDGHAGDAMPLGRPISAEVAMNR